MASASCYTHAEEIVEIIVKAPHVLSISSALWHVHSIQRKIVECTICIIHSAN